MEHTLGKIHAKPHDYKLCPICGNINWYENTDCIICNTIPNILVIAPLMDADSMEKWYNEEIEVYKQEGYTDDEIDNITKEI